MALSTDPHCDRGPDDCFGCKVRYWRTREVRFAYPQGQDHFHDTTNREWTERMLADCRDTGVNPEPCGVRWV